ncbi:sugar ABC transporter substrate-binding protein [Treponema rectale]|uniref:Ribose transport system substrate-binding protein n=1 Tax=Treponema rectale TaxID=744512 RepID=A0A840SBQ6_9SPIR|nr:substrate-binding domain-containing protein [Treponema rectale]MBB5218264.1 ribose transport system substrate-binding protein [Treponema rectale]QOS40033.1 sugar ABC transporter substrate-binding protein [Treponema rectale]
MKHQLKIFFFFLVFFITGCSYKNQQNKNLKKQITGDTVALDAERFHLKPVLDSYIPQKKSYNFYLTYKTAHPWWNAVALGIEDAVKQFEQAGVFITYDYLAPEKMSAMDQIERIQKAAASHSYDVIGVDVADIQIVTPVINRLMDSGQKVMTFSSSDSGKENNCKRIAYVGNTHNYEDGKILVESLCKRLDYTGRIAMLVGNHGAPCHEERALGAKAVFAKYPRIELVAVEYDEDLEDKAYEFSKVFIAEYPDLSGIICCNMSNSVGAGRAVKEAGKADEIIITGMDHDRRALEYLRDGVIYALALQDCYAIGFDTITTAVKIADGLLPGTLFPEKTEETTTVFFQKDADWLLRSLYGVTE